MYVNHLSIGTVGLHTMQSRMINTTKSSVLLMLGSLLTMIDTNTHRTMRPEILPSRQQPRHGESKLLLNR